MAQDQPKRKAGKRFLWILVAVFGVGFFGFMWQSTELTCERVGTLKPVDCYTKAKALFFIPLGNKIIHNVQAAKLVESIDDEGDAVYRIELLTAQGSVPLTTLYSSGTSAKLEVIEKLDTFLQNQEKTMVVVSEPGYLGLENLFWILFALLLILLSTLWEGVISYLHRPKSTKI